jgi:hypothetical protein
MVMAFGRGYGNRRPFSAIGWLVRDRRLAINEPRTGSLRI